MNSMKRFLAVLAASAAAIISVPAAAAPITYTFTGNFVGTLNGNPFDVFAEFTGLGNTDDVQTNGFSNYLQLNSLTALSGGVTYTITDPTWFYINPFGYAGLEFGAFDDSSYFSGQSNSLLGYDGISNVGVTPIDYFSGINAPFSTDMGPVLITGASNGTFSAAVSGAVPEPATWAMMIAGFGMTGAALRRRQTVKVSFAG